MHIAGGDSPVAHLDRLFRRRSQQLQLQTSCLFDPETDVHEWRTALIVGSDAATTNFGEMTVLTSFDALRIPFIGNERAVGVGRQFGVRRCASTRANAGRLAFE